MRSAPRWPLAVITMLALGGVDARAQDAATTTPPKPIAKAAPPPAQKRPVPPTRRAPASSDWYLQSIHQAVDDAERQSRCLMRERKRLAQSLAAIESLDASDRDTKAYEAALDTLSDDHGRLSECHSMLEPNVAIKASRQAEPKCGSGDPLCSNLPSHTIEEAIAKVIPTMRRCFRRDLEQDHMLEGTVHAQLSVSPRTTTPTAAFTDAKSKTPLHRCAAIGFHGVRLNPQDHKRVFSVALYFSPN